MIVIYQPRLIRTPPQRWATGLDHSQYAPLKRSDIISIKYALFIHLPAFFDRSAFRRGYRLYKYIDAMTLIANAAMGDCDQ